MKTAKELELSLLIKEANIQQLKLRINKAIEYIEKRDKWFKNEEYKLIKEKELLDILKGVDKK